MCLSCGCDPAYHAHEHHPDPRLARPTTVRLEEKLLSKNARLAARNRAWLAAGELRMINLIGSPGAGKTALLEASIPLLGAHQVGVLEGDQATARDAERIASTGCAVEQINTGTGCHLDATMVERGLLQLDPSAGDVVFVENVGNLVCPALFDLGEAAKAVVLSVAEGEDKPIKYPHVFGAASLLVLSKIDLVPHVSFDVDRCLAYAHEINPRLPVLKVSARTGEGIAAFCAWARGPAAVARVG
jgi:hydrogenase nickel incorporation protein HypB